jgi:hypothetical protein
MSVRASDAVILDNFSYHLRSGVTSTIDLATQHLQSLTSHE